MTTDSSKSIHSLFSIKPLVQVLKKMMGEGKPGVRKLYGQLVTDLENAKGLQDTVNDEKTLEEHQELLETAFSTLFPPSTSANQGMYAVCFPFQSETVYSSAAFKEQFLEEDSNTITVADNKTNYTIAKASFSLAYNLILRTVFIPGMCLQLLLPCIIL